MSKKRIIMPNTKVDKNNIGKQDLKFDEIYADNIIVDKINNKKVDLDYYLKDNFTIIYPNGGSKEKPANISVNTRLIEANPYPGYYIHCVGEIYYNNQWGDPGWYDYYYNGAVAFGVRTKFNSTNNVITIQSGNHALLDQANISGAAIERVSNISVTIPAPIRVLVWKVGKISDDD